MGSTLSGRSPPTESSSSRRRGRARVLLYFAKKVFVVNLSVSLLAAVFLRVVAAAVFSQPVSLSSAIGNTGTVGLTGGFVLGVYVYLLLRRHELPLYHNRGIRMPACIAVAYAFHALFFVPLILVGYALRAGS